MYCQAIIINHQIIQTKVDFRMKTYWYLVVGEDIWEKMVAKNLSPNAQTPRVGTWCLIFHIRESGKTPLRQRQQPGDA